MTPKDKAIELVAEMIMASVGSPMVTNVQAKKLAYACTEQIIMALHEHGIREPQYWYDIQSEIEKI